MAHTTHPDAQWFPEAGLGLFVHWGLSSVDASVEISWGMVREKPWEGDEDLPAGYLPPEEYFGLAEAFEPDAWNPDEWLGLAREAGAEYAVLTAKHHDGFALWPSAFGEFSTAEYLDGRDLVGEFVAACRRQGLRAGLYFSLPDWHHPDFPTPETYADLDAMIPEYRAGAETRHVEDKRTQRPGPDLEDPGELVRFERYYDYVTGQLRELMTNYGRIDLLWFDNPLWRESLNHRLGDIYDLVRSEQPGIVINGRTGYTEYGDYLTPERRVPERPLEEWWELAQTWGSSWGYTEDDEYRDLAWTLDVLSRTVAKGGNLLLNVGPKADGSLPDPALERLGDLAEWAGDNRQAVTGADGGPWPPRADVPITRRKGVWYVHVLMDHDPTVTLRDVPDPAAVRLLRTGETLAYAREGNDLAVEVPEGRRTSPDEVVAVSWRPGDHHLVDN